MKRMLAFLAVLVLLGLYGASLVLAFVGSPQAARWLMASLFASIFIPIAAYAYTVALRHMGRKGKREP